MDTAKIIAEKFDYSLPHTSNSGLDETPVVHSAVKALTAESEDVCYVHYFQEEYYYYNAAFKIYHK